MAATGEAVRMTLAEVRGFAERVLGAHGCDGPNAAAVAGVMAAAERDGAHHHGLFRLPGHVAMLRAGAVNGRAAPGLERVAPGCLRLEADLGFAPVAHAVGLPALAALAREQGVAVLAIRRCIHYAALWPEAEALAEAGLVAMAMTSSPPYVATAGGRRPVFGTNPMAFGWPRPGRAPMVWDQASAATSRGEVQLRARAGEALPDGAGIDADGRPTTDPNAVLAGGAQLPFGGYKGAAVALMVDLLAGPLLDELTSLEAGALPPVAGAQPGGEFLLAIDPARLGGAAGLARAERLFAALLAEPGVRLPGDRRLASRARSTVEGVAVPAWLMAEIAALGPG